jgi:hypothetical protein
MSESRFVRTENNVYYLEGLNVPTPEVSPEVTHHVMVVDRSGSMWGDIEKLKQSIEQALAVESFQNEQVLTTLISFSTHGDVTLHWKKVPVDKITDLAEPYIKILRGIRATALTGISQALNLALEHIEPNQTTGLTLFTDGYANSPSAYSENQALDAFVKKASEAPGLFMNCIGYRDWCDWPRMQAMTNALSGKTVKARSFKDVLDAMKDTQALLSGKVCPAVQVEAASEGRMLVAVNRTTGQVNATFGNLSLRGVGADDQVDLYAVAKAEATYNIPKGTKVIGKDEAYLFGALATAYTSLSDIRSAKELLFASGNKTLWESHQSAITPSSISVMLDDFGNWIRAANNDGYEMGRNVRPQYNLFDLAKALDSLPPRSVGLATSEFYESYRRRSIKRVPGTREEDGTITPPNAELVPRDGRVYIRGVSFNTTDASVQLETESAVDLKDRRTGEIVREVEYINLDKLRDYRSYTMVSCGERNVDRVPLEVYTKQAWDALTPFMIPSEAAKDFKAGKTVRIELRRFRMEADEIPNPDEILASIGRRLHAAAATKAYSAMQDKGAASPYTAEQVEALKEVHLSPALYFSAPTHTHYADKDEAIAKGEIDAFTRYRVFFGTTDVLSDKELKSGNAFCARRYKVTDANGNEVKKPKLDTYLAGDTYEVKPLSPRAKETAADRVMNEVFDEILVTGPRIDNEEITRRLGETKKIVGQVNDLLQPLVMEIGCTGLLPRDLEGSMTRYEPEDFAAKYDVKLGKAEAEGIYFVADNGLVISVIPDTSWYTVAKPAA